jgi:hypothetical protein
MFFFPFQTIVTTLKINLDFAPKLFSWIFQLIPTQQRNRYGVALSGLLDEVKADYEQVSML